ELRPLLVPASAPPDQLRETFEKYGVCVVTDVLSPQECALMEQIWLQDLLQVLDEAKIPDAGVAGQVQALKERGAKAWPKDWDDFFGTRGMAPTYGLPHGGFAWAARLHPAASSYTHQQNLWSLAVRRVFANLFEATEGDLAVGLDNVFWASAEQPGSDFNKEWLHVDQNHCTGMTWTCAQGVLYIWPSESESSSTTVVWPGSHKAPYDQLMQDPSAYSNGKRKSGQSVRLNQLQNPALQAELLAAAQKGCRRMPCPAGSLLLWDSRVIHQGWRGGPRLAQP
ncbi:Henmt1, partial [Symbiodinium pilosum]